MRLWRRLRLRMRRLLMRLRCFLTLRWCLMRFRTWRLLRFLALLRRLMLLGTWLWRFLALRRLMLRRLRLRLAFLRLRLAGRRSMLLLLLLRFGALLGGGVLLVDLRWLGRPDLRIMHGVALLGRFAGAAFRLLAVLLRWLGRRDGGRGPYRLLRSGMHGRLGRRLRYRRRAGPSRDGRRLCLAPLARLMRLQLLCLLRLLRPLWPLPFLPACLFNLKLAIWLANLVGLKP